MEGALDHVGIVHIEHAVLNRAAVVVKDVAHSLNALVAGAAGGAAVVAAVLDNVLDKILGTVIL